MAKAVWVSSTDEYLIGSYSYHRFSDRFSISVWRENRFTGEKEWDEFFSSDDHAGFGDFKILDGTFDSYQEALEFIENLKKPPDNTPIKEEPKLNIVTFGKYKGVDIDTIRGNDYSYYMWAVNNKITPFIEHNKAKPNCTDIKVSTRTCGSSMFDHEDHYYEDMMNGGCC